jgi:iron complex transport system substrate-binding protein
MTGMIVRWLLVGMACLAAFPAPARPTHIMSVNLCADQLVLALANQRDVVSVSHLARDCAISVACREAAGVPINHGTAEEMVAASPDILIAGKYTTRATVAIAHKFGMNVLELDVPTTFDQVERQVMTVADALGVHERGEAMVATFEKKLATLPLPPADAPHPIAAVYETNGFTIGPGSMIDMLLTKAGFINFTRTLGIDNYSVVPMELLVLRHPDILILNGHQDENHPSLGGSLLNHPVLAKNFPRTVVVPQRLWICGNPAIADALAILIEARDGILRARP